MCGGQDRLTSPGTCHSQHYFRHPAPEAFAGLLKRLSLPLEPVQLLNPSAYVRLRRLDLPEGALLCVLNSGAPATARLRLAPGTRLARLTSEGEEPVDVQGVVLELGVVGQNAVVLRLVSSADKI